MYFKRRQDRKRTKIVLAIMCETRIINFMTQIPDEGTPETNIRSKKKPARNIGPFRNPLTLYININNNNNTCMIKCRTPTNLLTWNTRVWHVSIVQFRLVHKLYPIIVIIHSKKYIYKKILFRWYFHILAIIIVEKSFLEKDDSLKSWSFHIFWANTRLQVTPVICRPDERL